MAAPTRCARAGGVGAHAGDGGADGALRWRSPRVGRCAVPRARRFRIVDRGPFTPSEAVSLFCLPCSIYMCDHGLITHTSVELVSLRWTLVVAASVAFMLGARRTYEVVDWVWGVMCVLVVVRIGPRYWAGGT